MNRRFLIPVALTAVTVLSWYMLIDGVASVNREYNGYLEAARENAAKGISYTALENYGKAIEMKNDPEVYDEVAEVYKAQGDRWDYLSWCQDFYELFPKEPIAVDRMLGVYLDDGDYQSCYDVIVAAEKRGVKSDFLTKTLSEIYYEYYLDPDSYDEVTAFRYNMCAVRSGEKWGFVTRYGTLNVPCKYVDVAAFSSNGCGSVTDTDGNVFLVSSSDIKLYVPDEKYERLGAMNDGFIAALKDGKYTYLDSDLKPLFGSYDYAGVFSNGVAAVENGGVWQIIDTAGNPVGKSYTDIKLDPNGIAARSERLFVSEGSGYMMVDLKGNKVCDTVFEDALNFIGSEPAAVKTAEGWRFIGLDGKFTSDKVYEEARPYSNGLAAVKIGGLWGYIDLEGNTAIEPAFDDARDFSDKGSSFVMTSGVWRLLKLYRLNRAV